MTLSRLTSTVTDLQLTARVKRRSAGADDFRRKNMSRFFSTSQLYWVTGFLFLFNGQWWGRNLYNVQDSSTWELGLSVALFGAGKFVYLIIHDRIVLESVIA